MNIERQKSFMIREQSEKNQVGYLNTKSKNKTANIFAGNFKAEDDPIVRKKKEAQQKAMKVVSDTFAGDQKIDNDLIDRTNHIGELRQEMKTAKDELEVLEQEKAALKVEYQISDESQEQKDLELLEKRRDVWKTGNMLTKEEQMRLKEVDEMELTDYQKKSLELSALKDPLLKAIDQSKKEILVENSVIKGINQERLKSSPMLKADQEAEAIMDAASDEIIGMLIEEAKKHLDEEREKKQEEAEKLAEEKEKEEEFVEEVKEKIEEMEELVNPEEAKTPDILDPNLEEEVLKLNSKKSDVQSEIEKIAEKMNLLMEDIKGAVVDSKQ